VLIKPDHLLDDCVLSLSFEGKERGIGRIQKGKKIKMRGENSKKKIFSLPPQNVIDQKRKFLYKERGTFFSSGNFFFFLYRYFFSARSSSRDFVNGLYTAPLCCCNTVFPFFSLCYPLLTAHHSDGRRDYDMYITQTVPGTQKGIFFFFF
jgi:hypothetical protein